jgi:hypothetical protein
MHNTVALAALATIISSSAFAAPCHVPGDASKSKWVTPLSKDEVYTTHPSGPISSWPFSKQRLYYSRLFKDSPQDACNIWALRVSPSSTAFTKAMRQRNEAIQIDSSTFECNFDCDGDGMLTANDRSACASLNPRLATALVQDTDPICDRMSDVQGPYANQASGSYVRGAEFTDSQKTAIKNADQARDSQGRLTSDAYYVNVGTLLHADTLFLDPTAGSSNSVQIDHLVPRKDVFGCGCGTNSPRNAGAVSAQLNNSMSNDPNNATRLALLCKYAPNPAFCPPPWPSSLALTSGVVACDPDGPTADDDVPATPDEYSCAVGP